MDRRSESRGDRRTAPRVCHHLLGRNGGGVTYMRWMRLSQSPAPGPTTVHHCYKCKQSTEVLTVAAKAA